MPVRPIATFFADDPLDGKVHSNELFQTWKAQNEQLLERLAKLSHEDLCSECVKLTYVLAGLQPILKNSFALFAEANESADRSLRQWEQSDADKIATESTLQRHREKQSSALAKGRPKGVKARQESAAKKQTKLTEAINSLFDKPDKPGWVWTSREVVSFLKKGGDYGYADSAMLVMVKREAAKHRKARKEALASQYPNR